MNLRKFSTHGVFFKNNETRTFACVIACGHGKGSYKRTINFLKQHPDPVKNVDTTTGITNNYLQIMMLALQHNFPKSDNPININNETDEFKIMRSGLQYNFPKSDNPININNETDEFKIMRSGLQYNFPSSDN